MMTQTSLRRSNGENATGLVRPLSSSASSFCGLRPDQMTAFLRNDQRISAGLGERIKAFIMLGRPRTCVPNVLCYSLGHSYTGAPFSSKMLLGALLSFLIGFSANLQNAYTDIEEDSRNLPGRIYLVAQIGHRTVFRLSTLLMVFMLTTSMIVGQRFFFFMLLAVFGIYQYSFRPLRFKERPIFGLWVFAQAVGFPFIFGWATEPDRLFRAVINPLASFLFGTHALDIGTSFQSYRYIGMMVFVTLWFMAKGAFKNVPDFYGDLAAGVRTSATVCGTWRKAAIVTTVATISAYLSIIALVLCGLESPQILIALVWVAPIIWNCLRLVDADNRSKGNQCLKVDMLFSVGFIASVLLLESSRWENWATVAIGTLVLFSSDLLRLDSRYEDRLAKIS